MINFHISSNISLHRLLKFLKIKSINDSINYFVQEQNYIFYLQWLKKILKSGALFIRVYISSITFKAIINYTKFNGFIKINFPIESLSFNSLKFSSSKIPQQQSIINLTNYSHNSGKSPPQEHVKQETRVQRFHNVRPTITQD